LNTIMASLPGPLPGNRTPGTDDGYRKLPAYRSRFSVAANDSLCWDCGTRHKPGTPCGPGVCTLPLAEDKPPLPKRVPGSSGHKSDLGKPSVAQAADPGLPVRTPPRPSRPGSQRRAPRYAAVAGAVR
jgi:hypothetical protein